MSRTDDLTPGQAQYVLGRAVADKKLRAREIDKYLKEMDAEIENLEERLTMLREAREGSGAATSTTGSKKRKRGSKKSKSKKSGKKKSRKATTPEAKKSRQLQGLYISLIKRFSGKERDKYKKIAKDKGREEAVKQMKAALGQ